MSSLSSQAFPLPPFFPLVRQGCEESASEFFQCLSDKSEPKGNSSSASASVNLCRENGERYAKCTTASLNAKGAKKPISLTEWGKSLMTIRGLKLSDSLDASGMRVAIIKTRWNTSVVNALVEACFDYLNAKNASEVVVEEVGGAFELPLVAQSMAKSGKFSAIIAIGCLIKGETMHFEYISSAAVEGIMRVGLDTGVPVINGILNVLEENQALARAGLLGNHENEAVGWAKTAVQQVHILSKYKPLP